MRAHAGAVHPQAHHTSITSHDDAIDGRLKGAVRYDPPGDAQPVDVTLFKTRVPAFIDRV
jgi:hypothetical protein